jgi:hypothetical protein
MKINDNGIDRDMTADEETDCKAFQLTATAEQKTQDDAQIARNAQRQILLDRLGITADEAALLLG